MSQQLMHLLIPLIVIVALYARRVVRVTNITISTTRIAVISAVMIYLIAVRIILIPTHPALIIISALIPLALVGTWAYRLGLKTTITRHPTKTNRYLLPTKQSRMFIIALIPYALTVVIVTAIDPLLMTQLKFILISTAVKSASFGFLLGFGLATLIRGRHLAAPEATS